MDKAKKQEFTLRMSQANRTGLLVAIYDLFLEYMKDAKAASDQAAFRDAVSNAQPVISELISALDFKYQLSAELLNIYKYCNECLAKALRSRDYKDLEGAIISIENIRAAFYEISLTDDSPALMTNSEKVYAGMTYGRNDVNEVTGGSLNRGYLV